jgi:fructose-bisphosphate aldolase class 1
VKVLKEKGVVPGIKVDKGTVEIYGINRETRKQGHDNVADRCQKYYDAGARFAKWRAVLKTGITEPSELAVQLNAQGLARYAIICQENGYQLNIKIPHSCSFLLSIAVHWLPMYSDVETSSGSFVTFSS